MKNMFEVILLTNEWNSHFKSQLVSFSSRLKSIFWIFSIREKLNSSRLNAYKQQANVTEKERVQVVPRAAKKNLSEFSSFKGSKITPKKKDISGTKKVTTNNFREV